MSVEANDCPPIITTRTHDSVMGSNLWLLWWFALPPVLRLCVATVEFTVLYCVGFNARYRHVTITMCPGL
jgi:hypothetical protein